MQLLVRNKVKDFSKWHTHFEDDRAAAAEYGVTLASLWQTADDPNDVFFLLDVEDVDRANAFMARPESQEIGVKSGVIDGEFHYLNAVPTDGQIKGVDPGRSATGFADPDKNSTSSRPA